MSFVTRVHKRAKGDYELRHACPYVRMEELGSQWSDFHKIWYLNILRKSVENIKVSLKYYKNIIRIRVLYMKTDVHLLQFVAEFFLEWDMF